MAIDVSAQTRIARPRDVVAAYATDVDNDPVWIGGISAARPLTDGPVRVGSQAERIASFLGRRIEYVLEVDDYEPGTKLAMRSIKAPFPMNVTYEFEDAGADAMTARIRIEGGPDGILRLAGPLNALAVKRSIRRDLANLKRILEVRTGET